MQKLAGIDSLRRAWMWVEDRIKTKADIDHLNETANGLKVILSDTAPTSNDESVLTLVVSTLPALTLMKQMAMEGSRFTVNSAGVYSYPFVAITCQAYLDGVAVNDALYRVESSSGYAYIQWTRSNVLRSNSFNTYTTYYLRVQAAGMEKTFPFTIEDTTSAFKPTTDSGFYRGDNKLAYDDGYIQWTAFDDTDTLTLRYYLPTGKTSQNYTSMELYRVIGYDYTDYDSSTVSGYDRQFVKEKIADFTFENEYASAVIPDAFTADDVGTRYRYLFKATTDTGLVLFWEATLIIDEVAMDHFYNHISRFAFNRYSTAYSAPQADDNIVYKSRSYAYFCYYFDAHLGYDIEVTITDRDGIFNSSDKFSFTIPAGKRYNSVGSFSLKSTATIGTHYFVVEMEGVGTEYSQLRSIEVEVQA